MVFWQAKDARVPAKQTQNATSFDRATAKPDAKKRQPSAFRQKTIQHGVTCKCPTIKFFDFWSKDVYIVPDLCIETCNKSVLSGKNVRRHVLSSYEILVHDSYT